MVMVIIADNGPHHNNNKGQQASETATCSVLNLHGSANGGFQGLEDPVCGAGAVLII